MQCKDCAYRSKGTKGICNNKKSDNYKDYVSPLMICKQATNKIEKEDIQRECFGDSHILSENECNRCHSTDCPYSLG